jgi:uncharacterized membrane protein YecN with MAPEG domain
VLAFWRGRREEQWAAIICVVGTGLTVVTADPRAVRFAGFDTVAFAIDLGVLIAFLAIALRSERFWPMWVAGLQLTATTVHPLTFLSPELAGRVFGTALALWSYPILILIAIGAWRTELVERWRTADDIASGQAIT